MSYGYYQPYWEGNRNELEHFGIKGMKWGIRRYQNPDGTLTDAGKKRYGSAENLQADRQRKKEMAIKAAKIAAGVAATGVAVAGANAGIKLAANAAFKIACNDLNNGRAVNIGSKAILAIDKVLKDTKINAINSLNGALNIKTVSASSSKKSAAAKHVQKQIEDAYYQYLRDESKKKIGSYNIAELRI